MTTRRVFALIGATIALPALVPQAAAALQVSQFSLTPSKLQAGGHPSLALGASFVGADTNSNVKSIALQLPPGLRARPAVAAICSRRLLIRNDCPDAALIGQLKVAGQAFGTSATITREIYNTKPKAGEKARLSAIALPGIAISIPVNQRPDGGLDVAITSIPQVGGAITAQLDRIEIRFKSRIRRRALLTLPSSCKPATTSLQIAFNDPATPAVTASSSFTPTGC